MASSQPSSPPTEKILQFDDVDADVLQCYHEISLANLLFYAMKEAACSEQSSRMTSMDAASKNAGGCGFEEAVCRTWCEVLSWPTLQGR